jgi:uracil-DNA glycosylase
VPPEVSIAAWNEVQARIWRCELCRRLDRVACDIRQRTEGPAQPVKLMLVGVAPPHVNGVTTQAVANSATNDLNDNLRLFVEDALGVSWSDLLERGLFLIHGVKCAIVPERGHQNPPNGVVDTCASRHFADEIRLTRPSGVVVFGKAPYRALLTVPGVGPSMPRRLGTSSSVATLVERTGDGVEVDAGQWSFRLYVSPFPLRARQLASDILRGAAREVGIVH